MTFDLLGSRFRIVQMRCREKCLQGISVVAIAAAISAQPALAQDQPVKADAVSEKTAPTERSQGFNEIIVTAQKRDESVMDVPIAISAFSGDTLTRAGVADIQTLQIATPSLVYNNTGAYAQPFIRGVGSRLLMNGFDPSVATYSDGRYLARQTSSTSDLFDIQRVEVLKGPQGVLFGRNASAGAIRVITNEVSDYDEGSFKVGYGNYNAFTAQAMGNMRVSDNLGVRIAAMTSQRDGYAENIDPRGLKEWDDKNLSAVRGKARYENGIVDANLTLSYWKQKDNSGNDTVALGPLEFHAGIAAGGVTGTNYKEVATQSPEDVEKEEFAAEFDLKLDLGSMLFSSSTTYADLDNRLGFEGDGTSAVLIDPYILERSKTFSQELQLSSNNDSPLEWVVGAYYYHNDTDFDIVIDIGSNVISQGLQNVKTDSYAVFGQVGYNITDALKLVIGGRYTRDEKTVDLMTSRVPGVVTVSPTFSDEASWSKFTPSATLEYNFADSLVYLKFARGYKSGGFNYPYTSINVVDPEVLDMYEIGLKSHLFDRNLRLTLSSYYYDYKDLQVSRAAAAGSVIVITQNAANAKLYGVEGDLSWNPMRGLTISTGFAWQHSEYANIDLATAKVYRATQPGETGPGMIDIPFNPNGEQLLRAPKFSAYASINYDIPIGEATMPLSVSYSYKGSYLFDFIAQPQTSVLRQKAYSIVNARLGFRPPSEDFEIAVWANNLFDERYFDDVVAAGSGIRGSYGTPRTYGVDLRFNF
ncbi:MAG: TonB-dependent receptor [Parasphingorhabdus sp.]